MYGIAYQLIVYMLVVLICSRILRILKFIWGIPAKKCNSRITYRFVIMS